jgi:hypothetical protein
VKELTAMANGKLRSQWEQTSQILALIHNVNREKGKKIVKADDFNPFAKQQNNKNVQTISVKELAEIMK